MNNQRLFFLERLANRRRLCYNSIKGVRFIVKVYKMDEEDYEEKYIHRKLEVGVVRKCYGKRKFRKLDYS